MTRTNALATVFLLTLSACAAPQPVTVWECVNYGINNVDPGPKDNKLYIGLTNNSERSVTFARVVVRVPSDHFSIDWRGKMKPKTETEFAVPLEDEQQLSVMSAKGEVRCSVGMATFDDETRWDATPKSH